MASTATKDYTTSIKVHGIIRFIVCILLTVICLIPIYILLINSTRMSSDITSNGITLLPSTHFLDNWNTLTTRDAYADVYNVWIGYRNSIVIAACSTVLTVLFSALTAYGLTVYDFKLKKFATTFILAVMMIPMQVVSTGFLQFMIQIGLQDNYLPLILPAIAAPSTVFFILQYMKSSFPLEIVEAARIDGSGEFRTFVTIALPMLKPAIAVQAIFAFVASWNNYYTPSMILISSNFDQKTMPMMVAGILAMDKVNDYGVNYLAIALSILPVVVIYLCLSKFIVKGVALGAVKG